MAIRLNVHPSSDNLIGKSHWWGAPDLPVGIPYPYVTINKGADDEFEEPLTFVCQIKCSDIATLDKENLLPHKGMLYFFAPLDYYLGELDSPLNHYTHPVVIYSEDTEHLQPYEIHWEGSDESIFRDAEEIQFSMEECKTGDGMLMLGMPYQQEVSELHCGEVCLLQIDEEDRWGLRFVDCGMYYMFIDPYKLANRDFSEIKSELFYY